LGKNRHRIQGFSGQPFAAVIVGQRILSKELESSLISRRKTMKKRTINRRDFLRMSAAVTAGAFLTGCASSATPAPDQPAAAATKPPAAAATEQPTEAAAQAAEAVTISWWNQYQTDTVKEAVARIIPDFQAKYPNIKVEYEISGGPPGGGDLAEVLLSRIAGGNPPDTVTLFGPPSQYGALGSLEAIDDLMAKATLAKPGAFYENVLKTCQWQGKTYGLPASAGALAIYIRVVP
jgi:ABC-type glycerol-3-phosphate transport system substrate-binding protein